MRVLHVVESLALGGAERVITDLIRCMPEMVSSHVCCLQQTGEMAARLPQGTSVFELFSSGGNDFGLPQKISRIIKENRIDIVHAHNWNTFLESIIGAQIFNSIPIIHTIHGPYIEYSSGVSSSIKKKLRRMIERRLIKKSCRVCVVSEAIKEYSISHLAVSPDKVEVVINGVDTELDYMPPPQTRCELGLNNSDIVICFVGRLATIKNLEYFFSILPELVELVPIIKVLLVGDGPQRSNLERVVKAYSLDKCVQFLGFKSNTSDYLHCADLFVLPSKYEGISVALLEAMAAGLPAVVTNVGGNGQLVIPGETGYLVPVGDKAALLAALVDLSKDPKKRSVMSINARKRVCTDFSLRRTVAQYMAVYQACLGGELQ